MVKETGHRLSAATPQQTLLAGLLARLLDGLDYRRFRAALCDLDRDELAVSSVPANLLSLRQHEVDAQQAEDQFKKATKTTSHKTKGRAALRTARRVTLPSFLDGVANHRM